jgi:hypothetical protein
MGLLVTALVCLLFVACGDASEPVAESRPA